MNARLRLALGSVTLCILTGCSTSPTPSTEADALVPADAQQQREVDLRYVSPTASVCASVWTVGSILPTDYEWCADADGTPVSGVRIGSCEVVVHRDEAYAVPGRTIMPVVGPVAADRALHDAMTSCKRRPAPTDQR